MKKFSLCLLMIFLMVPVVSNADTKIGISPSYVFFTLEDPDGDTEDFDGFQAFGVTTIHDMNNKYRAASVFNYYDFKVDPSVNRIGQKVKGYQLGAMVQRIIRVARRLNFYAGVGLAYTKADFTSRHTVSPDGYLENRYDDRDESFCSILGNVSKEWKISKTIEIGADITYQYAIGDGFSGLKSAVSVFYRF